MREAKVDIVSNNCTSIRASSVAFPRGCSWWIASLTIQVIKCFFFLFFFFFSFPNYQVEYGRILQKLSFSKRKHSSVRRILIKIYFILIYLILIPQSYAKTKNKTNLYCLRFQKPFWIDGSEPLEKTHIFSRKMQRGKKMSQFENWRDGLVPALVYDNVIMHVKKKRKWRNYWTILWRKPRLVTSKRSAR